MSRYGNSLYTSLLTGVLSLHQRIQDSKASFFVQKFPQSFLTVVLQSDPRSFIIRKTADEVFKVFVHLSRRFLKIALTLKGFVMQHREG
jgi:hypothetical protein